MSAVKALKINLSSLAKSVVNLSVKSVHEFGEKSNEIKRDWMKSRNKKRKVKENMSGAAQNMPSGEKKDD